MTSFKFKKNDEVDKLQRREHSRALAIFLSFFLASMLCFQVLPGNTLLSSVIQALVLAGVVVIGIVFADKSLIRPPRMSSIPLVRWIYFLLAMAFFAGIAGWWLSGLGLEGLSGISLEDMLWRIALIVLLCGFTGVFEEGLFRVLAIGALSPYMSLTKAVIVSAVIFGLMHASTSEAIAIGGSVAWGQAFFKPLQSALFGFFIAVVFVQTRNIWLIAGFHAAFNLLYLGPLMLVTGSQNSHVTGDFVDLVILIATTAILIVPITVAARSLKSLSCSARPNVENEQ